MSIRYMRTPSHDKENTDRQDVDPDMSQAEVKETKTNLRMWRERDASQ